MNATVYALAGSYLGLLGLKACGVAWQLRRARAGATSPEHGSVTILQPILSGDPGLRATLADSLAALPCARRIWLVDDDDEPAQTIARDLATPNVRVVPCPPAADGTNPKSWKLARGLELVDTEFVLVLDDDARLPAASCVALLRALHDADLTTALPWYRDASDAPSRLLGQFVNDNAALTYLSLLPLLPPVTVNGMCYALRTGYLRQRGGFAAILPHLTDDLAIADLVRAQGGRIAQLPAPVEMATTLADWRHYVRQMHRWFLFATLLLRRQTLAMNAAITMLHGLHPILLWGLCAHTALVASSAGGLAAGLALGLVVVARTAVLTTLQARLTGRPRHRPLLSLLSELLQPLHLVHACLRRTIRWRTRRYRVFDNHRFAALPEPGTRS